MNVTYKIDKNIWAAISSTWNHFTMSKHLDRLTPLWRFELKQYMSVSWVSVLLIGWQYRAAFQNILFLKKKKNVTAN